jgi:UDP-3-O-acyl N-acetylglucosamine deacetylase
MSAPRQQTVAGEVALEGVGLHTGESTRIRFVPAAAGTGIRFRRTDAAGHPEVAARLDQVVSTDRGTTLGAGEVRVHTVEHVLAAVGALGLDNLVIEVDGPEIPIGDGSFRPFFELLEHAGVREQDEPAPVLALGETVSATAAGGASYVAVPAESYRVSATIEFDHPLVRRQFGSFEVTPAEFGREISGARTFGFLKGRKRCARGGWRGARRSRTP